MEIKLPVRKRNRLLKYDYASFGSYFITICTKDKKCLFWENERPCSEKRTFYSPDDIHFSNFGEIVNDAINAIPEHYPNVELTQYVIMPNHIHLILSIPYDGSKSQVTSTSISVIVGHLKRAITCKIGESIWQRSFYDHIIRGEKDFEEISAYIYNNPLGWEKDSLYK